MQMDFCLSVLKKIRNEVPVISRKICNIKVGNEKQKKFKNKRYATK